MGPNANPKGILSQSPGLRGTSYPGKTWSDGRQPRRGCGFGSGWPTQPRWGCAALLPRSQGCSFLATLGWRAQSLRDWANSVAKIWVIGSPPGEGTASEDSYCSTPVAHITRGDTPTSGGRFSLSHSMCLVY